MCVTWLIHTCDMTHSFVSRDSFTCVTWFGRRWHFVCVASAFLWHSDSTSLHKPPRGLRTVALSLFVGPRVKGCASRDVTRIFSLSLRIYLCVFLHTYTLVCRSPSVCFCKREGASIECFHTNALSLFLSLSLFSLSLSLTINIYMYMHVDIYIHHCRSPSVCCREWEGAPRVMSHEYSLALSLFLCIYFMYTYIHITLSLSRCVLLQERNDASRVISHEYSRFFPLSLTLSLSLSLSIYACIYIYIHCIVALPLCVAARVRGCT